MLHVRQEPPLTAKQGGFAYQVAAVTAIKELPYAAVFHEQGLGKTKIAIDLVLYWLRTEAVDSVLIVTKKGLIENWKRELGLHSFLRPRTLGQNGTSNFHALNSPARVYLTHYEVLRTEQKRLSLFQKTRRVAVLLDEAHKMKNPETAIAQTLFGLASGFTRRVIMTGTPVANRPYDLWAPIKFLDGGEALGDDFERFRASLDLSNEFARNKPRAADFEQQLATIFDRIRAFTVRETKQTAGIELPEKEIHNVLVELEGRQAELYKRFRDELAAVIVREGIPVLDQAEDVLKRLLRLVQVASNPKLVDESYHGIPGKFHVLEQHIDAIADQGEKAIIWSTFTENVDWLKRELSRFKAVSVHGKHSMDAREQSLRAFREDPECKLLIATPAAAKEGLTLTVANHAIFYDRSFSLDDYLQAQDRIHRISQTRRCYVTNLIARHTIDEWVDVLLAAKHLAAQLGQGDITVTEYQERASYAFGDMIRDILGGTDRENGH